MNVALLSPKTLLVTGVTALALAGSLGIAGATVIGSHQGTSSVTSASAGQAEPSTNVVPTRRNRGSVVIPPDGSGNASTLPGYAGLGSAGQVASSAAEATAAQLVGVVDIVTTVDFGSGQAAGTGIVLTSSGRILTNNHVIEGSTGVEVTVLATGATYRAEVVGTSPTNDVAVLQLEGAQELEPAPLGDSSAVVVGDAVTGVGNAGNDPGTSAAPGTVTALDQAITATDSGGTNAEALTGLLMTNANIQSGDSGGPLLSSAGRVIGIDTAAQTSARSGTTVAGYAIPINHALDIAQQIVDGVDNATIHQGLPAFLGVSMSRQGVGTTIAGTVSGSAAESLGLVAGDTITAIGGTTVASAQALTDAIATHNPGDEVSLSWTSQDGTTHEATVSLGSGPAD